GSCQPGFLMFAGNKCLHVSIGYYLNHSVSWITTWDEARERCMTMSDDIWTSDLAYSINEDTLYQFNDYIANNQTGMRGLVFWVGAFKINTVSQWEWTDGQLVDSMSYVWNAGEPAESSTGTRGVLVPANSHRFYMISQTNTSHAPSFICEAAPKCDRE
ncbi:hypothetical protein OTU49_011329, partial [Cherax quadricarinatus]